MNGTNRLGVLCLAFALPSLVFSLDPETPITRYGHTHRDTSHGLPHDKVQALAQDNDGFLWVGTEGGLTRYDGTMFMPFEPAGAEWLATTSVRALMRGKDGTIWIGTDDGTLLAWRQGSLRSFTATQAPIPILIRAIAECSDGTIWVGASNGLFRLDGNRLVPGPIADAEIYSLWATADGRLWVPTMESSLYVLDPRGSIKHYTTADGLPDGGISSIAIAVDGAITLGTGDGLFRQQGTRWQRHPDSSRLPEIHVRTLMLDRDGGLWVGTWGGLMRCHEAVCDQALTRDGLGNDSINSLFEDREGNVWVGTRGGGLELFKAAPVRTYSRDNGLPSSDVAGVFADRSGRVWLLFANGAPAVLDRDKWSIVNDGGRFQPGEVTSMTEDASGVLWLVADETLMRVDGTRVTRVEKPAGFPGIKSVAADARSGIWAICGGALLRYRDGQFTTITRFEATIGKARRLLGARPDGAFLIDTNVGLAQVSDDHAELLWRKPSDDVYLEAALDAGNGTIWFVEEGKGLVRLENGVARLFDRRHGLPSEWVSQLLLDADGALWLGTHNGIVRTDTLALTSGTPHTPLPLRHFTTRDGLPTNYCESFAQPPAARSTDGRLWFATNRGVAVIDPRNLGPKPNLPAASIDRVEVDGVRGGLEAISAPPGRGDVRITFTAANIGSSERVRFRYRLDQHDPDWQVSDERSVRYSNLQPGRYQFRVVAGGLTDDTLGPEASLEFELRPHLYQTWTFRLLVALAAIALVVLAHRLRVRRLQARESQLTREVNEALARIKVLSGLLPICSSCKRIRDDQQNWKPLESYIRSHSQAEFTHSICPSCAAALYPEIDLDGKSPTPS